MHYISSLMIGVFAETWCLGQIDLIVIHKTFQDMLEVFGIAWHIQGHGNHSYQMMDLRLFVLFGLGFKTRIDSVPLISYKPQLGSHSKVSY